MQTLIINGHHHGDNVTDNNVTIADKGRLLAVHFVLAILMTALAQHSLTVAASSSSQTSESQSVN